LHRLHVKGAADDVGRLAPQTGDDLVDGILALVIGLERGEQPSGVAAADEGSDILDARVRLDDGDVLGHQLFHAREGDVLGAAAQEACSG